MTRRMLAAPAAAILVAAAVMNASAREDAPQGPIIATVNGEPVSKAEWTAIMKADQWHGVTLRDEVGYEEMKGKPFDDYFFKEEVVKIRVMAQKYKDALPQMKALIDEVHRKAAAGEDFAELARQYSQDATAQEGGVLHSKKKTRDLELKDMVFPFNRVMLGLKAGQVSEPVQTIFGYHVIKVEKVYPPGEGKGKRVDARHILIRYPSMDPRREAETLASQAKVEIVDKSLCKKLPSYCVKEG